ncbi:hypothetical protein OAA06_01730 [bacterium]|nr:hypothetical protein [bacterium]
MIKAVKLDKKQVVEIVTESFSNNPSVLSVIKPGSAKQEQKRIAGLAEYAFNTAFKRNGVVLSSDRQGVAICYPYHVQKNTFKDYWNQLVLAFKVIGVSRILTIMRRDNYVKRQRPKDGRYLYFWFLGVKSDGIGKSAVRELRDSVYKESHLKKLPIYLETSVEKNRVVYERFGFEVYHAWDNTKEGNTIWFMKRDPEELS